MDPQASYNLAGDTVPFNLAEILTFPINVGGGGSTTTSFHNNNNATSSINSLSASISMNLNINRDHDPMVMEQSPNINGGGGLRRRQREDDESAKGVSTSNDANAMDEGDNKRLKTEGLNENSESKVGETNSVKPVEQAGKSAEPPKQNYIHVRARRGQATDSHSLAERARREKISERMKILQDIVPGCNKVIGKALVLDEIINYIQSLQRQVEFLSMKLEAVNSRVSSGIEGFPSKDFGQPPFDASVMAFGSQSSREYHRETTPEWLHMQIGGGFERT